MSKPLVLGEAAYKSTVLHTYCVYERPAIIGERPRTVRVCSSLERMDATWNLIAEFDTIEEARTFYNQS